MMMVMVVVLLTAEERDGLTGKDTATRRVRSSSLRDTIFKADNVSETCLIYLYENVILFKDDPTQPASTPEDVTLVFQGQESLYIR